MSVDRPFHRGRFRDLPALPRRPHPYDESEGHTVLTRSRRLGELRIHYRTFGEGPPLLLVHGLMTTSYSGRYVLAPLGRHFRLFVPDLPGAGRSEAPPDGAFGAPDLAAWLGDFQRAVAIEGCVAIGNSMGGYLCMLHALASPNAYARLVDVHSPAFADVRVRALAVAMRLSAARALTKRLVRIDPLRWVHRNVHYYDESLKSLEEAHAYGDPLATDDGLRAFLGYLAETMSASGLDAFVASLRARRERGERFPIPLMLLYARRDPLVSPSNGAKLHALLPDATLTWLDDTSHFAQVDTPEKVVDAVLPFLQG